MSSGGNVCDNAKARKVFAIMKMKCVYRRKAKTINGAEELVDIYFYNKDSSRIITTGRGMH